MSDRSALVLAGGRSRRFGDRDKALFRVEGTPMVRRVADSVAPVVDELVVNCRREQRPRIREVLAGCPLEPRFAVDAVPDRGPVYGLQTGLRFAAGERAVVVGCDMPFLDPALLSYLLDRLRTDDASGVVPRVDGDRHPLCGAYHVDAALEACEAAIARSDPRLRTVLDCLTLVTVDESTVRDHAPLRALTNVNTPADIERAVAGH